MLINPNILYYDFGISLTSLAGLQGDYREFCVCNTVSHRGTTGVISLVRFQNCLFLFPASAGGHCNAPNTPHQETDTKTILRSPIHVMCTGALNYKIKPPAHESIKLKYRTQ